MSQHQAKIKSADTIKAKDTTEQETTFNKKNLTEKKFSGVDDTTLPNWASIQARMNLPGPTSKVQFSAYSQPITDPKRIHRIAASGLSGSSEPLPYLNQIQKSFGSYDVTNVRAYSGAQATAANRAIGSEAYASGNSVAFVSKPSLHTAAHEAAHIVQQRSGVQLKRGVGQAGDKYEQDADVIADAVVRGKSVENMFNTKSTNTILSSDNNLNMSNNIQFKMGFEFETGNTFLALDRKDVAYEGEGFKLEADTGQHLEFITDPFENWKELEVAIKEAQELADGLEKDSKENEGEVTRGIEDGWNQENIVMKITDPNFHAAVQSTEGVALENLLPFIREHLDSETSQLVGKHAFRLVSKKSALKGLFHAIFLYISEAKRIKLLSDDGPKANFRLLARTDFHSLYKSLDDEDQTKFRNLISARRFPVDTDKPIFPNGYWSGGSKEERVLIPAEAGPTIKEWLDSIITGDKVIALDENEATKKVVREGIVTDAERKKDLLSPPPGYQQHHEVDSKSRYSLGAYGLDENLALFEVRNYSQKINDKIEKQITIEGKKLFRPSKNKWVNFAKLIFEKASKRNTTLKFPGSISRKVNDEYDDSLEKGKEKVDRVDNSSYTGNEQQSTSKPNLNTNQNRGSKRKRGGRTIVENEVEKQDTDHTSQASTSGPDNVKKSHEEEQGAGRFKKARIEKEKQQQKNKRSTSKKNSKKKQSYTSRRLRKRNNNEEGKEN